MSLYGELREENLVLESTAHRDRTECSRLVRKRDNALYEPIQDAVERLKKSGKPVYIGSYNLKGKEFKIVYKIRHE